MDYSDWSNLLASAPSLIYICMYIYIQASRINLRTNCRFRKLIKDDSCLAWLPRPYVGQTSSSHTHFIYTYHTNQTSIEMQHTFKVALNSSRGKALKIPKSTRARRTGSTTRLYKFSDVFRPLQRNSLLYMYIIPGFSNISGARAHFPSTMRVK